MGSYTDNLVLFKADPSDVCDVNSSFGDNFSLVDMAVGFRECTSLMRPVPFEGLKIWEKDTNQLYIYANGAWVLMVDVAPVAAAGGRKAFANQFVTGAVIANTETDATLKVTFTAEVGRRYWVESSFSALNESGSAAYTSQWFLRWAAGASVTVGGTSINGSRPCEVMPIFPSPVYFIHEFVPNIAGSVTVGWFVKTNSAGNTVRRVTGGGSNLDRVSTILVRDVGV